MTFADVWTIHTLFELDIGRCSDARIDGVCESDGIPFLALHKAGRKAALREGHLPSFA
jgi:hypothetical protein